MAAEPQRERPPHRADPARPQIDAATGRPAASARGVEGVPLSGRARRPVTLRGAAALQRQAGNRAVSRLIGGPAPVQRLAGVEGRPSSPAADPKFAALTGDVGAKRKLLTTHAPPAGAAAAAASAAVAPPDDKQGQAKAAQADTMNAAKPGEFNKAAFIKAVNEAIAAQAPKTLGEAQDFGTSGKAEAVKGQVSGQVSAGKHSSAEQIESATKAPPDTSVAKDKPVTTLPPDRPPPTPATPDPANAVPDKAPPEATDFSAGPRQVNSELSEAGVTEEQLAKSNEPEFTDALAAKKEGEEHSAAAPGKLRESEGAKLSEAKGQARLAGATAMNAMTADRVRGGAAVQQGQHSAKSTDEKRRADATALLQKVFDATKADVEAILTSLDKTVDEQFTREEKAARDAFTSEHHQKMEAYKDERYSGLRGKYRWVRDKIKGLPEEANQIFVTARAGYVSRMQGVISRVADTIATTLAGAKVRIARGQAELQAEVKRMPADLQAYGRKAAGEFAGKFDELTENVNSKSQELVQTLAAKYSEAMKSVDEEIDAEQAANKGLIDKAIDAVKGVVKTILALKDLLLNVLAKAGQAIAAILSDPIGFLGNLVSAVGAGLKAFIDKIETHLKNGLVGWLLGAVASTGLQMPAKFDLKGIIGMIASLLGLTWNAIRGRIVSRGVPDKAIDTVEKTVPIAQKLQSEGVAGIWETIKERVGDLKDKLLSKISDFLIPTVLIAGITWLISLLNPASAFVKAVKMIVDIVTFIVERGAQIAAFVSSVLDAVIAIAGGGGAGVPGLIEKALAGSIPVLIGALAAFLGIGGIADKVKAFFQSLSKPVMKAVDWVADKLVKFGKSVWGKMKACGKKLKDKAKAGAGKLKDRFTGRQGSEQRPPASGAPGLTAALAESDRLLSSVHNHTSAERGVASISQRHNIPLHLVVDSRRSDGEHVHVQTVSTREHVLPVMDAAVQARLLDVRTRFTGLITAAGGDAAKAEAVCTFRPAPGASAAVEDFLRDAERSCRVLMGAPSRGEGKAAVLREGVAFALRRRGTAGAPGEFANVFEYFVTHWQERYEAELEKQAGEVASGLRASTNGPEAARRAADSFTGRQAPVESALYRDRAKVRALGREGGTADPSLSNDQLIARIRDQAGQLNFSGATAGAYHSRKHGDEIPESRREAPGVIANYYAAASRVVREGAAAPPTGPVGSTRQVIFTDSVVTDTGMSRTLRVIVYARAEGRVVLATFGKHGN